ncbi:MAG: HEAT repeat domain-containing protein [Actinomycetota bacterium]
MAGHGAEADEVLAALSSTDPALRRAALGAATRLGVLPTDRLLAFFADPDPAVAQRAVTLAGRLPADAPDRPEVARRLAALLGGPLGEAAAFSLGELEWADDAIVAALGEQGREAEDPLVRESAIAALGVLGRGRATVLAAMADVATVRRRAAIAMANFDGPEVDAALTAALDDRDWQVRQVAEDLLGPPPDDLIDDDADEHGSGPDAVEDRDGP